MKQTEAWKYAELLAELSRRNVKIVKVTRELAKLRGEVYAFTLEGFPIDGEIVGVAVYGSAK